LNEDLQYTTIDTLNPQSRRINLRIKVLSKDEEKTIFSKRDNSEHKMCYFLIGDNTGCINLILWDDLINNIEIDHTYEILNAYITVFNNSMQVSLGKYGSLKEIDEDIETNTEYNLSEKFVKPVRKKSYSSRKYGNGGSKDIYTYKSSRYGSDRRKRSYNKRRY